MIIDINSNSLATINKITNSSISVRGKRFVITGRMEHYYPRDKFAEMIEQMGGTIVNQINSNVDFLIYTNMRKIQDSKRKEPTTKVREALAYGITILSETEAEIMMANHPESKWGTLNHSTDGVKTFA